MWKTVATLMALIIIQESAVDRARRMAESFSEHFADVQCKERVVQSRLRADGKVTATQTAEFDYVAFLKVAKSGLAVEESRVPRSVVPQNRNGQQLLITSGFPTFLLMFHPEFRSKFEFTEISTDPSAAPRIAFRSRHEAPSMSALKLRDSAYPIFWKGIATLDPATGAVRRIEASLDAPMDDVGLSELRVEVNYAPTVLPGAPEPFWLPIRATISLNSPRQAWKNVHDFSDYKRFSVTTKTGDGEHK